MPEFSVVGFFIYTQYTKNRSAEALLFYSISSNYELLASLDCSLSSSKTSDRNSEW